jgi:CheY-like chemotaxis protein
MPFKVLVVDDEPFICRSLCFVLRKEKYEVFEARNGEEALEAIRRHRPDLGSVAPLPLLS